MLTTVEATLNIEVNANCPHCRTLVNIMEEEETDGYNHNEEGRVLSQACPEGYWMDEHRKFEVMYITCGECKKDFNVKGLNW